MLSSMESTGWSKKVRPLRLKAHICYVFKTLELISMIFDTLLLHFLLNISVDPKFIKFIVQSGTTDLAKVNNLSFAVSKRYESSAYDVQQN